MSIIGMALKLYWDAKQHITVADWGLIEAYLVENERLFGIAVEDLPTVEDIRSFLSQVYRKVVVKEQTAILTETANR